MRDRYNKKGVKERYEGYIIEVICLSIVGYSMKKTRIKLKWN